MKSLETWKFIGESLGKEIPVMLLYVLESYGSSPGRPGFLMAVNLAGEMEGSLGGGIMEHKFVEMAKSRLVEDNDEFSVHKQIHKRNAVRDRSGMICSGEQTILIYPLREKDITHVHLIITCLEQYRFGALKISPGGLSFSNTPETGKQPVFKMSTMEDWEYEETIGYQNHLYIVGAGHCALGLSRIMKMMDFYIYLFDDRPGLKTMTQNNFVHEKRLLADYSQLSEYIQPGANHYIVIMTVGYRSDEIALKAIINKDFKYLGLLGSKSKIDEMFADLRKQGVPEDNLKRVRAPVGLPVNSHTPEEVAISIAAEIIQVKNKE